MSLDRKVQITIDARDNTSAALSSAESRLGKLGQTVQRVGGIFTGALAGAAVGALADAARAAAEDEAAMVRLQTAVEAAGEEWQNHTGHLNQAIEAAKQKGFADDQAATALSNLTAMTGSAVRASELLATAQDLARGKGISLADASEIVGKVATGNTGILGRYGIVVDQNATAQEALAQVQRRFAGQAEAYGETTAGAIDRTKNSIDDFIEGIGAALGPAQGFIAMIPGISQGMTAAGGAIGFVLPKLALLATAITGSVIPAAGALVVSLAPILVPLAAIALAVGALWLAWENNFLGIRDITANVIGFLGGLFDQFASFFRRIWDALPGPVQNAIGSILAPIRLLIDTVRAALDWLGRLTGARVETPRVQVGPSTGSTTQTVVRRGGPQDEWSEAQIASGFRPAGGGRAHLMEHGGIVMRPTLATIAESGPEAVIPLDRAGDLGGTMINHFHIGSVDSRERVDELADAVAARFMQFTRARRQFHLGTAVTR